MWIDKVKERGGVIKEVVEDFKILFKIEIVYKN